MSKIISEIVVESGGQLRKMRVPLKLPNMDNQKKVGRPSGCYTIPEIARFYSVSQATAYRWAEFNEIPVIRRGGVIRVPKNRMDIILRDDGIL